MPDCAGRGRCSQRKRVPPHHWLLREFRLPLDTSYKGNGLLDENHPRARGGAGLSPKADGHLLPLINKSDCILLLGYDPIEMRVNWRNPWGEDAPVVDVTPVLRTHGMHSVSATLRSAVEPALSLLD